MQADAGASVPPASDDFTVDLSRYAADVDRIAQRISGLLEVGDREALAAEMDTWLEEIRVGEEEMRAQHEALLEWQMAARTADARYKELFDHAPVGYVVTDENGLVTLANAMAIRLTAMEQRGLVGRPLVLSVALGDRPRVRTMTTHAARGEEVPEEQIDLLPVGHPPLPVIARVAASGGDRERPTALRWTLHDISRERREADLADELRHRLSLTDSPEDDVRVTEVLDRLADVTLSGVSPDEQMRAVLGIIEPLVPAAVGVSLTMMRDGAATTAASSGPIAAELDALQQASGEGPCFDALRDGHRRRSEDLRVDPRWPALAAAARRLGIAGVLAVPVRVRGTRFAVLNTYAAPDAGFDLASAQRLESVAHRLGVVLANVRSYEGARALATQMESAMHSRAVIEQAKGILAEREQVSLDAAFALLRTLSQSSHRKLRDVALEVVKERGGGES
jgi:GAF domain-containing protein